MTAPVPNGEGDGVVNPKAVRVLMNEYDNPITVGRVYRVHEWRKLRGRKGLFPRIYGDDGRTITLDQPSHYEAAELPPLPIHLPETDRIMSGLDDEKCLHTDGAYCGIDCGYCIGNAFDALVRERDDALARANTATVAADLMRARAEKAERERDAMREERDDAIGRTSMERYSDGRVGEARMESVVYKLGVCSGWYFDDYDCSVEMLGVRNGWLPTKDERDLLSATGISIAWLSYLDGTGVMVHLTTGQHGPCSPRGSKSDKSALVAKLEHERDEARAALSTQRGEGGA